METEIVLRKVALIVALMAAISIAAVVSIVGFRAGGEASNDDRPLFELLRESGYLESGGHWLDSLPDEHAAMIDIAYESDAASGYQGTRESWASEKLLARYDADGDIVVALPDGGEFIVRLSDADDSLSEADPEGGSSDSGHDDPSGLSAPDDSEPGGPLLSVANVQAHAGDADVAVAVRIGSNPGILGMTLAASYDESAMTLKSADSGEAFKDVLSLTHSSSLETGCLFTWDGIDLAPADVKDGTILTLHFDVSKDAAPGIYPVAIRENGSAIDANLQEVSLSIEDGSVVVE